MEIDYETGNIEKVSYESYEAMKEEKDNKIEELKQKLEDSEDRIAELEEQLKQEKENTDTFVKLVHLYMNFLKEQLKKDSIAATNESKMNFK